MGFLLLRLSSQELLCTSAVMSFFDQFTRRYEFSTLFIVPWNVDPIGVFDHAMMFERDFLAILIIIFDKNDFFRRCLSVLEIGDVLDVAHQIGFLLLFEDPSVF